MKDISERLRDTLHQSLPEYRDPNGITGRIKRRARRRTRVRIGVVAAAGLGMSVTLGPQLVSVIGPGTSIISPAGPPASARAASPVKLPGVGTGFPIARGALAGKAWTMYSTSMGTSSGHKFERCLYGKDAVLDVYVCYNALTAGEPLAFSDDTIGETHRPAGRSVQGITESRVRQVRIDLADGRSVLAPTVTTPTAEDVRFFTAVTAKDEVVGVQGLDEVGSTIGPRVQAHRGAPSKACTTLTPTPDSSAADPSAASSSTPPVGRVCPAEPGPHR